MGARFARSWCSLLLSAAFAVPAAADGGAMDDAVARGHRQLKVAPVVPRPAAPARAQVAIIIDDLGEQQRHGLQAIDLPGPVAMAFLPGGRFTAGQARFAHARGKEVLLHLPLQPGGRARAHPTALRADAGREQLREYFDAALAGVPHASGVNNHQGSLATEQPEPMDWLMREIAARPGLYFVDSRTSASSVAYRAARHHGVPSTERNVFLDSLRSEGAIREAFDELVTRALRDERALAIGHPYPETLKVLREELPKLARYGIRLVAPSELIARQAGARGPWRPLKLSPALTLATTPALPGLPAATSASAH